MASKHAVNTLHAAYSLQSAALTGGVNSLSSFILSRKVFFFVHGKSKSSKSVPSTFESLSSLDIKVDEASAR